MGVIYRIEETTGCTAYLIEALRTELEETAPTDILKLDTGTSLHESDSGTII